MHYLSGSKFYAVGYPSIWHYLLLGKNALIYVFFLFRISLGIKTVNNDVAMRSATSYILF